MNYRKRDPARGGLMAYDNGAIGRRVSEGGWYIITESGRFIQPVQKAKDDLERAKSTLWNRIGHLEFHGTDVYMGTKLYDVEGERHLRAELVNIDEDGYPWVLFRVVDSWPAEYVELTGEQLAQRISGGYLKSQQQIHDDFYEAMEAMREGECE